MIDDTEFSELCCIIDSREKRKSRIERIKKFVTSRGGMVDIACLELCDYKFEGTFRGKEINLGIEFKEFVDFNNSKDDLAWKLFESGKLYTEVALFVQENNFGLSFTDTGTFIKIPHVPDGSADITNYYAYKNQLDSFASDGIHVRTFQHETFFEEDVYSLLIHITKDCHNGLHLKGKDSRTQFMNLLCKIDGIGAVKAHKFVDVYPNLEQFINHAMFDGEYEKIAGTLVGKKIRNFVIDGSRVADCMANYQAMFNPVPKANPSPPLNEQAQNKTIMPKIHENALKPLKLNPEQLQSQCDPVGTISNTITSHLDTPADDNITSDNDKLIYIKETKTTMPRVITQGQLDAECIGENVFDTTENDEALFGKPHPEWKPVTEEELKLRQEESKAFDEWDAKNKKVVLENIQKSLDKLKPKNSSHHLDKPSTPPPILKSSDDQGIVSPSPARVRGSATVLSDTDNVIKSLDDAIVDFCYEKPMTDFEILSAFQMRGFQMPEIHKTLKALEKTKLRKSKRKGENLYGYNGIKGDIELDVGV